jgi:hypothetical protein
MGKMQSTGTDNVPSAPGESSSFVLIMSMADTTWRMFVPTIPLIILGDSLDKQWNTKPWLMLAGAVVGGLIAAWLIRLQLRRKA